MLEWEFVRELAKAEIPSTPLQMGGVCTRAVDRSEGRTFLGEQYKPAGDMLKRSPLWTPGQSMRRARSSSDIIGLLVDGESSGPQESEFQAPWVEPAPLSGPEEQSVPLSAMTASGRPCVGQ